MVCLVSHAISLAAPLAAHKPVKIHSGDPDDMSNLGGTPDFPGETSISTVLAFLPQFLNGTVYQRRGEAAAQPHPSFQPLWISHLPSSGLHSAEDSWWLQARCRGPTSQAH